MTVTIVYHGHACFEVRSDKARILIDPYFSGNPMADLRAEQVQADYILVTHAHSDHLGDAVPIARRTALTGKDASIHLLNFTAEEESRRPDISKTMRPAL